MKKGVHGAFQDSAGKTDNIIRETGISRHNGGRNKGPSSNPCTPVMQVLWVSRLCQLRPHDAERRYVLQSLGQLHGSVSMGDIQFMEGIGGKEIKQQHAMTSDAEKDDQSLDLTH